MSICVYVCADDSLRAWAASCEKSKLLVNNDVHVHKNTLTVYDPRHCMSAGWERVLWKKQAYPDNYIPPSFLSSLRRNSMYPLSFSSSTYDIRIWTLILSFSANFRPYTYWPLVLASCAISQHLSAIFIFLVTFSHLYDESWDPRILVWVSICMFLTGFAIWELFECFMFGYNVDKEHSEWTNHVLSFLRLTKCVWTF